MKRKLSILLTLILVLATVPFAAFGANEEVINISILGTSDLHGRIYPYEYATDSNDSDAGLAKIATVVKTLKAENPNSILFDCGDTVQDNSAELFNDLPVHPMIQAMNMIGYDAWVLGNHEFNFSMDFLNKNIAGFEGKVLAANIYKKETNERFVAPYEIFDIQGVKVAVVGMMPPNVPIWEASTPEHFAGLEFTNVLDETGKALKELEGKYDVLVGAYHIGPEGEHGYDGIELVAEKYPQFSVIFGGHAHSKYTNEINGVKLIEPGSYGWAVSKADISLTKENGKWSVKTVEVENVETAKADADPEILTAFKFVDERSLEEANKVVGQISADFIKNPDYYTGKSEVTTLPTAQIMDTSVIDLINEVQMYYSKADISSAALFNFGSNLKQGVFKKKDVAFIYKYDNTLMGVNITGENLLKYMEWSANYFNTYKEGDLTISFNPDVRGYNYDMFSGITYEIDLSNPSGSRIVNAKINGASVDLNKVYKLAVNNYRFGTLISLDLVKMEDKYYDSYEAMQDKGRVRDLIIAYTQDVKNGKLDPAIDNNWKIIGTDIANSPYLGLVNEMIKNGTLTLPASEDGRTLNVKAINVQDLINSGLISVKGSVYKVQSGDVLWKIAKKYHTTWQALQELNQLKNPNLIMPGQMLNVPAN
ncbi:5'-nucleotidase C-terminal domain-containing protein [Fusibacter sp. 3D3]|uniref:5'-nucleotidase C-terminal domain-containing protein n=1 Tax=Fusibacter sp. 3D3 TaxID=1048380 RepID=UPI000853BF13|nr:5'-nucleotidase C-terminal domain-containing protein [Fusibacter sp. 3D3]GAU77040.1 2',3'-cyclic-nucleotide 2'-phosphodiesterase [Fusibacter sp. 3D3]